MKIITVNEKECEVQLDYKTVRNLLFCVVDTSDRFNKIDPVITESFSKEEFNTLADELIKIKESMR